MDLKQILAEIDSQISRLQQARQALSGLNSGSTAKPKAGRRTMSAAARRRIAKAQRARWAKVKRSKTKVT